MTDILTALHDPKNSGHLNKSAAGEIERLRSIILEIGTAAGQCQHELQGRLADDEHKRAFRVLGKIKETCWDYWRR